MCWIASRVTGYYFLSHTNYVPLLFDRTHEREVKLELLTLSVYNVSLMETESSVWIHHGCLISINLAFSKVPPDPIWSTCKRKRSTRDNPTCNNWKATRQFYAWLGCLSIMCNINPLRPNIHLEILHTDLYMFPWKTSWEICEKIEIFSLRWSF